ncbi:MAG: hypothetical protein KDC79_12370 [Cyclobacteriaceae bacterium]|nr:hypothetical protein [Cyclobacteriaceae bacterium]
MRLLVISSIVMLFSFTIPNQECDDIKFDVEISNTTNGLNNGKIDVTIIKTSSKVRAYLYGDKRSKNKLNVEIDELKGLEAGKYTLILQNKVCSVVKQDIVIE